jgi:hypothetical protein
MTWKFSSLASSGECYAWRAMTLLICIIDVMQSHVSELCLAWRYAARVCRALLLETATTSYLVQVPRHALDPGMRSCSAVNRPKPKAFGPCSQIWESLGCTPSNEINFMTRIYLLLLVSKYTGAAFLTSLLQFPKWPILSKKKSAPQYSIS